MNAIYGIVYYEFCSTEIDVGLDGNYLSCAIGLVGPGLAYVEFLAYLTLGNERLLSFVHSYMSVPYCKEIVVLTVSNCSEIGVFNRSDMLRIAKILGERYASALSLYVRQQKFVEGFG